MVVGGLQAGSVRGRAPPGPEGRGVLPSVSYWRWAPLTDAGGTQGGRWQTARGVSGGGATCRTLSGGQGC